MLDIRRIRETPDDVRRGLERRSAAFAPVVDLVVQLDENRRSLLQKAEALKAERNRASEEVARRKRAREDAEELIAELKSVSDAIKLLDQEVRTLDVELEDRLLRLPNVPMADVPEGDESANQVLRTWGDPPALAFEPRPHWELGEALGILDLPRGAKLSGSGFPVFTGDGARLVRALVSFMIDLHTSEHGYREIAPPYLVNADTARGTGQLPTMAEDMYVTAEGLYLIPTAEVPVTNLHAEEILGGEDLLSVQVGHRDFGGRDEVQPFGRDVHVLGHGRQLSRAPRGVGVHQIRGRDLAVAVLGGVQIDHEADERAHQPGTVAREHGEAAARQLGASRQIEDVERLPQIPVRPRLEWERGRIAPGPDDLVRGLVALRHLGHRHVRQPQQTVLELDVEGAHLLIQELDGVTHALELGDQLLGVLTGALAPRDLLRRSIALRLQCFGLLQQRAAVLVELHHQVHDRRERRRSTFEPAADVVGRFANPADVEHRSGSGNTGREIPVPAVEVHQELQRERASLCVDGQHLELPVPRK